MSDMRFPWLVLVPRRANMRELFHLTPADRETFINEVNTAAERVYNALQPAKMNVAMLGNMVPHMHWHLVPRFDNDPLWPKPIWAEPHEEVHLTAAEYAERIEMIKTKLKGN